MQSKIFQKRVWIPSLIILLTVGGYIAYDVVFVSDIPFTKPNVNHKTLDTLEIRKDFLYNIWGDSLPIESGQYVVPENRADPESNRIEIYFSRLKSTAMEPSAPLIFLAGGPGSSGSEIGQTKYFYLFKELAKSRDVILLDQRGTGRSIPNLSCRNSLATPKEITSNVQEQILKDLVRSSKACANEFREMGIQLSSYNSLESVMDIDALRNKLGYDEVILYGYSYGTELAQLYIKQFGENVNKAILAGAYGPDQGLKLPLEAQMQFEKMDSLVCLDRKLSKYIPNFLELVESVHNNVQTEPWYIKMRVQSALDDDAEFAERNLVDLVSNFKPYFKMYMTEDHLQMMVTNDIGTDSQISGFPNFYYKIARKEEQQIGKQLREFCRRRMPNALFFTVTGASRYSEARWQEAVKQDDISMLSHFGMSYGRFPEIYEAFGIEQIPGLNDPVSATTKTLFIGGEIDGRTPPNLTDTLVKRFPNHFRIHVENAGHNSLMDSEIMAGIQQFLTDSLQQDFTVRRKIEFDNPVPYNCSITDSLLYTFEQKGMRAAIQKYESLYTSYSQVEDYIYEFKPDPIYKIASDLMEQQQHDEAIQLLEFATTQYPESNFLFDYLGLAYLEKGDHYNANINAQRALKLDFFDGNAHVLLKKASE